MGLERNNQIGIEMDKKIKEKWDQRGINRLEQEWIKENREMGRREASGR